MLKSDRWIIKMAQEKGMIQPFEPRQVRQVETPSGYRPVISYGVSSYGYDIRVGDTFKILDPKRQPATGEARQRRHAGITPPPLSSGSPAVPSLEHRSRASFALADEGAERGGGVNDPKNFDLADFEDFTGDVCLIPAHGMAIAQSLEYFRIPRNVLAICQGKSTYARCGVQVAIAPLEPEWEGRLTFAIHNTAGRPAKIYAREGIAQVLFLESDEACRVSYADKAGKYQKQTVLTPPTV